MQQKKTIKGLITLVLAVVVVGLFVLIFLTKNAGGEVAGDTGNLVTLSIKPGDTLRGQMDFSGALAGGYFFEAQARGMLLDADKKELLTFPLISTSFWTTNGPVGFAATLDVGNAPKGPAYLRLANANPSGDSKNDKTIDIPVIIK